MTTRTDTERLDAIAERGGITVRFVTAESKYGPGGHPERTTPIMQWSIIQMGASEYTGEYRGDTLREAIDNWIDGKHMPPRSAAGITRRV